MSAPDTKIANQKRRHRGPLIGMALVVLFGVALIVYWLLDEAATADSHRDDSGQSLEEGMPTGSAETGANGQTTGTGVDDDAGLAPADRTTAPATTSQQ